LCATHAHSASTAPATPTDTGAKMVIIGGNFITVPGQNATGSEKQEFEANIASLAVTADKVQIGNSCQIEPAFVKTKSGASVVIVNSTTAVHGVVFSTLNELHIDPSKSANATITQTEGAYPILCDGQIAGFYIIQN
jgi:plastocyanin